MYETTGVDRTSAGLYRVSSLPMAIAEYVAVTEEITELINAVLKAGRASSEQSILSVKLPIEGPLTRLRTLV